MSSLDAPPLHDRDGPLPAPLVARRFVPTEIDLFMFCAATWNTHRIHFDRDYARTEGYPDLVVPGPLQTARLAQMLSDFAVMHGGRLLRMSVRHREPVYCNETVDLRADLADLCATEGGHAVEADVCVSAGDGRIVSNGRATLALPASAAVDALLAGALPASVRAPEAGAR